MSKRSDPHQPRNSHESAAGALTELTSKIHALLVARLLDGRLAAKLLKHLGREADAVAKSGNAQRQELMQLMDAFHSVNAALREYNGELLVAANAALRTSDDDFK